MSFLKSSFLPFATSLIIAITIFLKNAWVTEDSYILFRSIEQLFAGNGPVWNPHDRVQVYTSPLWYLILSAVRLISDNSFLNVIFTSLAFWLGTVLVLKSIFKSTLVLLISVLLLTASTAFFDYTSSGLENVLAYFIITLYIYFYLKCYKAETNNLTSTIKIILALYGLIICVRHDLALLLFPSTLFVIFYNSKVFTIKQWLLYGFIAFLPFVIYSLFSLLYYGFPLPNTAYAKLYTGIDKSTLLKQGIQYFYSSLKHDSITLIIISSALLINIKTSEKHHQFLSYGIILNLLYICYVGGDFMQGRFFSYAYLISTVLILVRFTTIQSLKYKKLSIFTLCCYLVFYPHTPFYSPLAYKNFSISKGIADERGYYARMLSLYSYINRDKSTPTFPNHPWAEKGAELKESSHRVVLMEQIGVFGYYAGTEKIIIDPLAISDPLLARIPVHAEWRIGHFRRQLPVGYFDSIVNNNETITNPQLNEYYKKLKILTQEKDLFSRQRLKTILLFNFGFYNHLLAK